MADLKENAISLLSKSLLVDMNTATKEVLYTVPVGKKCIVTHVVVHTSTGALGTDNDFGAADAGVDAVNDPAWQDNINLAPVIAGKYWIIETNNALWTVFDAGKVFGVLPVTGANEEATIDVFGYLF